MKILDSQQALSLDSLAINKYGIAQAILMEHAAHASYRIVKKTCGIKGRKFLVLCGPGNNGGDGLALARLLLAGSSNTTVLFTGNINRYTGASADNYNSIQTLSIDTCTLQNSKTSISGIATLYHLDEYDCIVDALFGVGLSRDLSGTLATLVDAVNSSSTPVLSLDIPSGIDSDTGAVLGTAIRADATVTFILPKLGNLLYPGYDHCGKLYHSDLFIPQQILNKNTSTVSAGSPPPLPERKSWGHKGVFGKVMVIGGSPTYLGAPAFTAAASMSSGAGYSILAVPSQLVDKMFSYVPEAVFQPVKNSNGFIGPDNKSELLQRSLFVDSVVLGPGLSTHPGALSLVPYLYQNIKCSLVMDGDALTAIAGQQNLIPKRTMPTVLTPHAGEMSRLLDVSISEVESDRIGSVKKAASQYQAIVVYKGAHTLVADPEGQVWMNLTGNSGMGTAGSGDILAGIIGTLLTQMEPFQAAQLGTYLHGLSGDLAATKHGEHSITARTILENISAAFTSAPELMGNEPYSGRIKCL